MSTEEDLELLELQSSSSRWLTALALAKEATSRVKREDLMAQELRGAQGREDRMWQHIRKFKRREVELLEDQESRKKQGEDLQQERDSLLQQRDGLKALLEACQEGRTLAISSVRRLHANIVSRDEKHAEVENDLVSRLARAETNYRNLSQCMGSLVTVNHQKVAALKSLEAEMAEMKEKLAVQMKEKENALCKQDLTDSITELIENLSWQVGFFAENVRKFKDMLPRSKKRPSHGETASVTRKAPPESTRPGTSLEHVKPELMGLQILESEVAALLRELGDAYMAMDEATIAWLGKPFTQVGIWSEPPAPDTVMGAEQSLPRRGAPHGEDPVPASEEPITMIEADEDHKQEDRIDALSQVHANGADAVPGDSEEPDTGMEIEEAEQMQNDPANYELSQENIDLLNEIWAGTWSPSPESDVTDVKN